MFFALLSRAFARHCLLSFLSSVKFLIVITAKPLNFIKNFTRERTSCALAIALSALNSIKFNARRRILKFTAFFAL